MRIAPHRSPSLPQEDPPWAELPLSVVTSAPRPIHMARTRPLDIPMAALDTPERGLGGLSLADLLTPPQFHAGGGEAGLEDLESIWDGTPSGVGDADRSLYLSTLQRPLTLRCCPLDGDAEQGQPASPASSEASSSAAEFESFYVEQWHGLRDAQRRANELTETWIETRPTYVDDAKAPRVRRGQLSHVYEDAASEWVTDHSEDLEALAQQTRERLAEVSLRITQRVGISEVPSQAERAALNGLRRTWKHQAALLTRVQDGWHAVMERRQDMQALARAGGPFPALVRDPLSAQRRHLRVQARDLERLRGVSLDLLDIAQGLRGAELSPLITDVHRLRGRLENMTRWELYRETRLEQDRELQRPLRDRGPI